MLKSVFARLVASYLVILVVILSIQALMMVMLYQRDNLKATTDDLIQEANAVSVLASSAIKNPLINLNTRDFITYVYFASLRTSSTIWVTDREGNIIYEAKPEIKIDLVEDTASDEVKSLEAALTEIEFNQYIKSAINGETLVKKGEFSDRFDTSMLTVGVPIYIIGPTGNQQVVGVVFMHTALDCLQDLQKPIYRQIYISALIMLTMGIIAAALNARRIANPLKRMSMITSQVIKGDFEGHVHVKGNDEIATLALGLNHMVDELKRQESLKGGFVANVSHELRSPLTSMQGFAQGLLDGTIPKNEQEKYVNIILTETRRLNKLITDLLDLAQIDSGNFPLNIKRFEINEVIRKVIIRYIDRIEEKGIELEVDFKQEYYYVNADSDRIEQVIINLLDNAIKFTQEGGIIKIWTYSSQGMIYTSISDSGDGIPNEDIPYIFERFYKADKAHTEKAGTGLGLSIIKQIINQHDQNITVNSEIDKGTSFVFSLQESTEDI